MPQANPPVKRKITRASRKGDDIIFLKDINPLEIFSRNFSRRLSVLFVDAMKVSSLVSLRDLVGIRKLDLELFEVSACFRRRSLAIPSLLVEVLEEIALRQTSLPWWELSGLRR